MSALHSDDLLGSYEDVAEGSPSHRSIKVVDSVRNDDEHHSPPRAAPVHIALPPRPTEMSPDYAPPRRVSFAQNSVGPSSPPSFSYAGNEIVFHPHVPSDGPSKSPRGRRVSGSAEMEGDDVWSQSGPSSPTRSQRMLHTIATSTKLASKWKSQVHAQEDPHANGILTTRQATQTWTAQPVDITHETPFMYAEVTPGSNAPPTGAPGFRPEPRKSISSPRHRRSLTSF